MSKGAHFFNDMAGKKKKEISVEAVNEDVAINMSATVDELADCVLNNPALVGQLNALGFKSKNPNGMTFKEAMICSQIANAIKGDLKSYRAVMDYTEKKSTMPLKNFVDGNAQDMPLKRNVK